MSEKPHRLSILRSKTTEELKEHLKEINEILAPEPNCCEFGYIECKEAIEEVLRERKDKK